MYASGSFNRFISHLQDRALYISCALSLVLKINGECEQLEWGKKCKHAIQLVNAAGKQLVSKDGARGGRTIQDWFVDFRSNRKFSNPFSNLSWSDGIQFFANNPGLENEIKEYWNINLATLSCGSFQAYIVDKIIPRLVDEQKKGQNTLVAKGVDYDSICVDQTILDECGLKTLCLASSTASNWLQHLGFRYVYIASHVYYVASLKYNILSYK